MKILRWLAAIPAGMIAGWLVILAAFFVLGETADPEKRIGSVLLLICAAISGAIFIYVAAAIAPSHKKLLAWILAGASVAVLLISAPGEQAEQLVYVSQNLGCVVMAAAISFARINLGFVTRVQGPGA